MELIDPVVVAGDLGFAKRARNFADMIGASVAFVEKRRLGNNSRSESLGVIGDVRGQVGDHHRRRDRHRRLDRRRRRDRATRRARAIVYAACTHALLTGPAVERLRNSPIQEIIVTDTVGSAGEQAAAEHDRAVGVAAAGRGDLAHPYRRVGRRAVRRPGLTIVGRQKSGSDRRSSRLLSVVGQHR